MGTTRLHRQAELRDKVKNGGMTVTTKSNNADIRELQTDIKYIRESQDKILEQVKYTNGKVAQAITDIQQLKDDGKDYATKQELSDVKNAPALAGNEKWEWWKVALITSGMSIFSSGLTAYLILKFVH